MISVPFAIRLAGFIATASLGGFALPLQADVPKVIFDSDMSSDWDDVGDIGTLHGLASLGECEIIGMGVSSNNGSTPLCMDAINTYYGKPDIPIGVRPDISEGGGNYAGQIASEYPHGPEQTSLDFPVAASLYRQLLAANPAGSVTIVTVGFMVNIRDLLQSGPDQYSPLNGMDLVAQKTPTLACVGGWYPSGGEFNFTVEPATASYVVNNWPSRVIYTGFELGAQMRTAGRLPETPVGNPIRRVYVDIIGIYPYAAWGQIGILQAVRPSDGLYNLVNTGRNNANADGSNFWTATPDPSGDQDQGYWVEKTRFSVQESINALMNLAPNNGLPSIPGWPSNMRATIVSGSQIDLQWTDNSFNETGFILEGRGPDGTYSQIAALSPNVETYSDTGLSSVANQGYRVKAINGAGESSYSNVWVYTGWTETNFQNPGALPLYVYYQSCHLSAPSDFAMPHHVTVNNDSTHAQTLTIDVDVAARGHEGIFHVYFFYQDANNWYRLNVGADGTCRFEKTVAGAMSQVGATGTFMGNIAIGSGVEQWKIEVVPGNLKFTRALPNVPANEMQNYNSGTLLNVGESLSFSSGRIGLGSANGRNPVWQNFRFSATGSGGGESPPPPPSGLAATAGDGQAILNWASSAGAASYEVYRGTSSGGQSATPVITGLTTTGYTNTGLTNGTAYYYKVMAVNAWGASDYSNEASATPVSGSSGGGGAAFANSSFETPSLSGYSYAPAGSGWTFANYAGIQHNGSAYSGSVAAPDGVQTGFVQGFSGTLGTMSQSVEFLAGTYTISLKAARRWGTVQPVRISIDGATIGTCTPSSDSFEQITTAEFSTTAGTHTITFAATDNVGDKTTFIDQVSIGGGPPALTGIDAWRQQYFGTTDDTGIRADSANPSGDGLPNLLKFALGLDPNIAHTLTGAGVLWEAPASGAGGPMSLTFTGVGDDLTYIVEATSDLRGLWTTLYTHSGPAPGLVTVNDTADVNSTDTRVMRLRVVK